MCNVHSGTVVQTTSWPVLVEVMVSYCVVGMVTVWVEVLWMTDVVSA